jgi:hypothetical protein
MEISAERTYLSRRDAWLTAILWFAVVEMAVAAFLVQLCPWSPLTRAGLVVLMVANCGLCLCLLA